MNAAVGSAASSVDIFEQLGFGSECTTWRNNYLVGALELRDGVQPTQIAAAAGMAPTMTVTQLFDTIAIRVNGPEPWSEQMTINWNVTDDESATYRMELSNGALVHYPTKVDRSADLSVQLTRIELLQLIAGGDIASHVTAGDPAVFARLLAFTDEADPDFAIVTP